MTKIDNYYEYCDNGCSGGSCITCDDTLKPTGQYDCIDGYSYELYRSECGRESWDNRGGSACCNDTAYPGGTAYATGCTCAGAGVSYQGYPTRYFCLGSTSEANSYTERLRDENKANAEAAAKCGDTYSNEEVWISKQKTNCPSNCTAKGTVSYRVSANSVSKTYCSQSAANDAARSQFDANAQTYANNQSADTYCDCPEEPCRANISLQRGSTHSSPPGISWSVTCTCSGNCSSSELSQMRSYSVTVSCASNNDSTTESGNVSCNAGTGERTTFFSSSCDPSTISVSLN